MAAWPTPTRLSRVETSRTKRSFLVPLAFLLAVAVTAYGQAAEASPVLQAMKDEMARSLGNLKSQIIPPYFLSYEITETHSITIDGAFGKVTARDEDRRRQLDIDLRVGDPMLDNTHEIRGRFPNFDFADRFSVVEIPIEDDPDAIRSVLWYQTDQKYKHALEQL